MITQNQKLSSTIRHSGFSFLETDKVFNTMILEKLYLPFASSFVVGTASATVSQSVTPASSSLVVGLLGVIVTIGLWGLGHLITLSIKMSRVETQIEDLKDQVSEIKEKQ